jgi:hypothetical protein
MSPAHIPFRLVTIPMGMYSAIDEQDIHLPVACVVIERWITESPTIGLLGQTSSPVFEVALRRVWAMNDRQLRDFDEHPISCHAVRGRWYR